MSATSPTGIRSTRSRRLASFSYPCSLLRVQAYWAGNSRWLIARWCLWSAMLVWAKSSNYPLAAVLVPLALYLGWRAKDTRVVGIAGACVIAAFALLTMLTRPTPMRQATTYNSIFMAILPESRTPDADLQALGLYPRLVSYSGTGAWTPRTAFGELYNGVLLHDVTGATVARFYLLHPARIWRRAKALLPVAFSLRPEWCGNFEASAGRPEGAEGDEFLRCGVQFMNTFSRLLDDSFCSR